MAGLEQLFLLVELAAVEGGVEPGDVAHAHFGQQVVAAFHLLDRPGQCVGRLLGVHHHLGEQVRKTVVLAQLHPLGVDQDEPDLIGRGPHEDRGEHRVDARRLSRSGGPGHQHVGHLGQVYHHRPTGDVPAQCHLEGLVGLIRLGGGQDVTQGHQLTASVGHLHADGRLARNGRQDPDVGRCHGIGDVLGQRRDPGHLDPGPELELVAGHRRTDGPAHQSGIDPMGGQGSHQRRTGRVDLALVDGLGLGSLQYRLGRKAPIPHRGSELHLQLGGLTVLGRRRRQRRKVGGTHLLGGQLRLTAWSSGAGVVAPPAPR